MVNQLAKDVGRAVYDVALLSYRRKGYLVALSKEWAIYHGNVAMFAVALRHALRTNDLKTALQLTEPTKPKDALR